jgi:hypothetical protein
MSAHDQIETTLPDPVDAFADDTFDNDDWDVAPAPKRRMHWTTLVLALGVACVIAFAGGILAQKHWGKASTGGFTFPGGGSLPAGLAANLGSAAGGAGGFGGAGTTGTVSYIQGTTLYVTTASGSVVKVRVAKGVPVSRTVESKASGIRPGESVVIQGTTADNGTVKATSVTVSPK